LHCRHSLLILRARWGMVLLPGLYYFFLCIPHSRFGIDAPQPTFVSKMTVDHSARLRIMSSESSHRYRCHGRTCTRGLSPETAAYGFQGLMDSLMGRTASAKQELLKVIVATASGSMETDAAAAKIDELVDVLSESPAGRKFRAEVADGNWALIFTRNADGSPALQKMTRTSPGNTFANFQINLGKFDNVVEFLDGAAKLNATVLYSPDDVNCARISCNLTSAELDLFGRVKLPLPLRFEGGWLDFVYMDDDLRITRGNAGGLFVHVRPGRVQDIFCSDEQI